MDPQKLFFLDKRVVRSDRVVSLFFSLSIAGLLVLIQRGVIDTVSFSWPVFWLGVVGFTVLGLVQMVWDPYTRFKVLVYDLIYASIGALISIYIIGFASPLVFLGWLMLIITAAIYFNRQITALIYGIFFFSLLVWIIQHYRNLPQGEIVELLFGAVFISWITIFILTVWELFNRSVHQLDTSRENERLVRERLSSLINSMVDGVLAVDEKHKIVEYNGALLNILDMNLNLRGKDISRIGKLVDQNNQPVDLKKFIDSTKSQQISRDFKILYKDKSTANVYISVASVHLGFGHEYTRGFVLVMRDITREKSLEEERDEFISVVSHELRTPIAIAEGNLSNAQYIAKEIHGNEPIKDALKQAHEQILFLSGMINDLATLSRAERGKLNVEIEEIETNKLIDDLIDAYTPQAKDKGLKLEAVHTEKPMTLCSSRLYVREILQNFITNAIKYTEKGSVTIAAAPTKSGVSFTVTDTGIGISKSDQERVFDKFFRSEDYRTRANSGTGLGLYVTVKLARMVHADIDLKSKINQGSTFTISIPNLE